eukprot:scaffold22549_cov98-Cylindrotheca_fusiformis.AAC.2
MADMMYFMKQNKKKEEVKKKERAEKEKHKDVNMCAPSFDRKILNNQKIGGREKNSAQAFDKEEIDMAGALSERSKDN